MKFDPNEIIKSLSSNRPIFDSEDDLKFSLAWEIKNYHPKSEIRLEKRMKNNKGKRGQYIDMLITDEEGHRIGIELKYFTSTLECKYKNADYSLKTHSAPDIRSYYCWEDVSRLEGFVANGEIDLGYTFWLTNDKTYWSEYQQNNGVGYDQFKITDNRRVSGELKWKDGMGEKTIKGRNGISLTSVYTVKWESYSTLEGCINVKGSQNNKFQYVLLKIS